MSFSPAAYEVIDRLNHSRQYWSTATSMLSEAIRDTAENLGVVSGDIVVTALGHRWRVSLSTICCPSISLCG